jgi:tripartite ATP-independent transporter DctM subunit
MAFLLLFTLGFPVTIALALPSIIYLIINDFSLIMMVQRFQFAIYSYPLIAVPVFIFVGNLMNLSGITNRIFDFSDKTVGKIHGGLAQVNAFASLIFSGMSGAALADIGGLGHILIDSMGKRGFKKSYAAAVTCATATVGPIFPPSIPIVVYASVANVSLIKLLVGGIVPGILITFLLMLFIAYLAVKYDHPRSKSWPTAKELFSSLFSALPALLAPAVMVIGMLIGIFTPTEAASFTVVYMLLVNFFIYKEFSLKHLITSAFNTIKLTASVLILFTSAALFNWVLTVEGVPQMFSETILSISTNPIIVLFLVNIMLLIIGMFIGGNEAIIIIVPIILKPLTMLGVDPIHLGIIVVYNLMLGLVTPPYALSLFLGADIAECSIDEVIRAILPFYIPLGISLLLITYIPELVLWLPNLFN